MPKPLRKPGKPQGNHKLDKHLPTGIRHDSGLNQILNEAGRQPVQQAMRIFDSDAADQIGCIVDFRFDSQKFPVDDCPDRIRRPDDVEGMEITMAEGDGQPIMKGHEPFLKKPDYGQDAIQNARVMLSDLRYQVADIIRYGKPPKGNVTGNLFGMLPQGNQK